jgi:hypothetical protein
MDFIDGVFWTSVGAGMRWNAQEEVVLLISGYFLFRYGRILRDLF